MLEDTIDTIASLVKEEVVRISTWKMLCHDLLWGYIESVKYVTDSSWEKKRLFDSIFQQTKLLIGSGALEVIKHTDTEPGYCYLSLFGGSEEASVTREKNAVLFILDKSPTWIELRHTLDFCHKYPESMIMSLTVANNEAHLEICQNLDSDIMSVDPAKWTVGDVYSLLDRDAFSLRRIGQEALDEGPNHKKSLSIRKQEKRILKGLLDRVIDCVMKLKIGSSTGVTGADGYCYLKAYGKDLSFEASIEMVALATLLGTYPTADSLTALIPHLLHIDKVKRYNVSVTGKMITIGEEISPGTQIKPLSTRNILGSLYDGFDRVYSNQGMIFH